MNNMIKMAHPEIGYVEFVGITQRQLDVLHQIKEIKRMNERLKYIQRMKAKRS